MSTLPAGPGEPPLVQTLRWLVRPTAFLQSCRRRFGDAFSVTFLGFQSPLVMISDPEAIRELYSSREHGLPPGRTVTLSPIVVTSFGGYEEYTCGTVKPGDHVVVSTKPGSTASAGNPGTCI